MSSNCYTYYVRTGQFFAPFDPGASGGALMCLAYSGHGAGLNNPEMEQVPRVGPIPRGLWRIDLHPLEHSTVGPFALALTPEGHDAFGRSLFRIHGDNGHLDHSASLGCIVMPRPARLQIIHGVCNHLLVKP